FLGLKWAAILAVAFCGIDFAGIIRLFTPEEDRTLNRDNWFLFAAWLMAATMNAILTWWGISMSIASHPLRSSTIMDPQILTTVVPLFVAMMVWVTRILLIGSFSFAGQRLVNRQSSFSRSTQSYSRPASRYVTSPRQAQNLGYAPQPVQTVSAVARANHPAKLTPRPRSASPAASRPAPARPEPEYVPDPAFQARSPHQERNGQSVRRF
ncbi:MAG TPA: hypothetical protein VFF68_00975, partial [Anaerolineaceae bacterium]|nr:hypothetical protein [Anaerolineaceae bacterium]